MSEQEVAGARVKRVVLENGQLVVTGTRNQEYELVVSLNHETAQKIMDVAGIDKSNPNYNPYYAQAMAAAHHNRRFNGDEEAMIKSFAEEMQKPEMTPEKLKNFERNYRNYVLEQQQKNASGSTFANRDESAPTIDKNIQETVRSGVELRKKINPTFPDIMYDNGLLTDVVLDLSDEAKESSAIGIINSTVDKYNKYGMKFDAESNQFQVKGKPVNVQKFYSTKKNQMDKFLANLEKNGGFDASDKELFEVIENGDYQKFLELKKQRGGQDKRNMFLRNALNDEILFDRFSEEVKGKENSLENITGAAKTLSEDYGSKSDIISKESERGKITSTNTGDLKAGEIDRIVFSAKPFQVASQSTYQNWKSCMNAVGLNHRYVDDSIGQGSIVAYGYNSKNPQNKISRLLIHPWINEKGETLYVVNDRIYGESNSAFQNSVSNFTESLNQGKKGLFRFNVNTFPGADGLYNDNSGKNTILRNIEGSDLDFSQAKKFELSYADLSQAKSVKFPENVSLSNVTLGENVDFSNIKNLELNNVDLSRTKSIKFPENVKFGYGIKLGGNLDFSDIKNLDLSGVDLSEAKSVKFPENVKFDFGTKLGGNLDFSNIKNLDLSSVDLSQANDVKFSENVKLYNIKLGEKVDFGQTKNLELVDVDLSRANDIKFSEDVKLNRVKLGENIDFSSAKNLDLSNVDLSKTETIKFPENVKLDMVTLGENVDFSQIKNLELSHIDLSKANNVKFPEHIEFGYGTKLGGNLNFSQMKNLELKNVDLSEAKSVKFPEDVKFGFDTKLGGNLDFNDIKNLDLSGVDLSEAKSVKFPENVKFDYSTKFGGDIDFSNVKNLDLSSADLSEANIVKFPESIKLGYGTEFKDNVDLSSVKNIEISDLSYIDKFNISGNTNIKLEKEVEIRKKEDLNTLKRCDTSETKTIFFDEKVLSEIKDAGMEFPTGKILGFERNGKIVVVCDEKSRNELIKNSQIEENKVDFMSPEEFSQKEGVKFETKTAETQIKPHEPETKTTELKETLKQQAETKSVQNEVVHQTKSKIEEPIVKTTVDENTPELKETLKGQSEAAHQIPAKSEQTQTSETKQNTAPEAKQTQKTEAVQTQSADADLRSTLKNQKASGGLGNKISAVSNSIDNTLEKAGKALNDNAVGRAISEAEAWRPHNKTAAKIMDKTGAVPIAAITASGVSAYEQYKAGDTKGALETMGKGTVHAAVQGIGTQIGMNAAAKGLAKGTEKVVTKVTEHNLTKKATQKTAVKTTEKAAATTAAKAASKQVVKTAAKTAGKAAGKAVLKKIPLVSLAAGAYFAYERVKDGEWGKAGCELLSGAAGCVPGVGTVVSTGIDCGLAVADTKQAIDATKKQQAQQQPKTEQKSSEQIRQEQKKKAEMAKKAEELRNTKPGQSQQKSGEGQQKSAQKQQKMAKIGKPAEKNWIDYIKNAMSSR